MGWIYSITNKINGKQYIGQTSCEDYRQRWYKHKNKARHPETEINVSYLHRAMNKEGIDNFEFSIIEEVSNEQLDEKECYYIKLYNTLSPNGYNLTEGGAGTRGYSRPQTPEENEKRSASLKKYYAEHPEARKAISERFKGENNPMYGKHLSEETKQKMSERFRGENNPFYGKKHTPEAMEKIMEAAKKTMKPIQRLDKDTLEVLETYDGIKIAARAIGNKDSSWISRAARENRVAYGYRWRFIEESVTTNK